MRKLFLIIFINTIGFSNPYFDKTKVPLDKKTFNPLPATPSASIFQPIQGDKILRVLVNFESNQFNFQQANLEYSGTQSLQLRANKKSPFGSYHGILEDFKTHQEIYFDSIGTGKEYPKLSRALSFRFPNPNQKVVFKLIAENETSGIMEEVLKTVIDPSTLSINFNSYPDLEIKVLKQAPKTPSLKVNIYAEGYQTQFKDEFFQTAQKVIQSLTDYNFPELDKMEFTAIYATSNLSLGKALNLGLPVKPRDSFLGLYFPYWNNFGRWYHVVYPTNEDKYRKAIAVAPYDYPIVLVRSSEYWGVGNFRELTAIPSHETSFSYLLVHEFGHYFGLNEEYEGGGRTELEFAKNIQEPWSPNITFLNSHKHIDLKWNKFVTSSTPLPTSSADWPRLHFGAYKGGYADSDKRSHKPGFSCTMDRGPKLCEICNSAISEIIDFDLGK